MQKTLIIAMACLWGLPASAAGTGPLGAKPEAFTAASGTAVAITGPVTLSTRVVSFGNGKAVALSLIADGQKGQWDIIGGTSLKAQVLRLAQDPGPLLNRNTLCGGNRTATFLVVYNQTGSYAGPGEITLLAFHGDKAPKSSNDPSLCGSFGYAPK